jgi:hypothetical protein
MIRAVQLVAQVANQRPCVGLRSNFEKMPSWNSLPAYPLDAVLRHSQAPSGPRGDPWCTELGTRLLKF